MKKLAVFAVFTFILGIGGLAWGHVGLTWYAAEITSANPIAIDGDLSDWAWIDEEVYVLTGDDLMETLGGDMPSKDDWDAAIYPGWSRSENIFVKLRTSGKFISESEERHSFDHTSKELA